MQNISNIVTENELPLVQAFVLFRLGCFEPALAKCLAITNQDSQNEEATLLASDIYQKTAKPAASLALLADAHKKVPRSLKIKLRLADAHRVLEQFEKAISLYEEALADHPENAEAANNLARILIHLDRFQPADDVWRACINNNDGDPGLCKKAASMFGHFGRRDLAEHWLQRAGEAGPGGEIADFLLQAVRGGDVPERVPAGFVQQHFDKAATNYDRHLQTIGSNGPAQLPGILARLKVGAGADLTILDAGCGTGLAGSILRPCARVLHGVDLSSKMLEQANNRNCYDKIICQDIIEYLGDDDTSYDLILAADMLTYFGGLNDVFLKFHQRLAVGGLMVFSIETMPENVMASAGFILSPNGRYKHQGEHIVEMLKSTGFDRPELIHPFVLRYEYGEPVDAVMVVAKKIESGKVGQWNAK